MNEKNYDVDKFRVKLKQLAEEYDRKEVIIRQENNIPYEGKGTHPLLLKLYREFKQNVKLLMEECRN